MDSQKMTSASLIEAAQVPLKPFSPRVFLNLVLGLLTGLLGGLCLAFFLHFLDDSLQSVEDVEDALEIPVLISIPYDKKEMS
jgi:capsular polysaccharide biosynthesis protein